MRRRVGVVLVALLALAAVVVVATGLGSGKSGRDGPAVGARSGSGPSHSGANDPGHHAQSTARGPTITVSGRTVGHEIRPGFLGFSFEFQAVRAYTGNNAKAVNPVLVQLIRNLSPAQAPMIRIGGDSTDASWVPAPGVRPPAYVTYRLTPSWLATTAALTRALGARMTLGVNLAANQPRLAGAEVRSFVRAFGLGSLAALEIGNEPNVYGHITVLHTLLGAPVYARPRSYAYASFFHDFTAEAALTRHLTLAAPALAAGPDPSQGSWIGSIPIFLRHERHVRYLTVHRYPLRNCFAPPSSPQYPTVANLLSGYSTAGLAHSVRRWLRIAHGQGRQLRIDELNSVACRGRNGVSDVFAASLWAPDALFSLARAGVDGVNVHTLPSSAYQLFAFSHRGGHWHAQVKPVYYGLELFAQAAPPGSRLLGLGGLGSHPVLSAWATRAPDGSVRVLLINKNGRTGRTITLRAPAALRGPATLERLAATSVHSDRGITLGGRSYGATTYTGRLGPLETTPLRRARHGYTVAVPGGSAALITLTR